MQNRWSIDFIVRLIALSLCNPILASLVPVTMLTSTALTTTSLQFRASCLYASGLWIFRGLRSLDRRYRRGRGGGSRTGEGVGVRRVVIVTGGSSGLGRAVASVLSAGGQTVYNFDVEGPADPVPGTHFIACDVSSVASVRAATARVMQREGEVSAVVCNAAQCRAGTIADLAIGTVEGLVGVNLVSHFILAQQLLPIMAADGQWVTVGSSLGHVGVYGLAGYCVTKAGTLAFHESLTVELARSRPQMRTLLITPGQIDTALFQHVRNPSQFLAPTLDVLDLARDIVHKIETREAGEFGAPLYAGFLGLLRVLPSGLVQAIRHWSGVDRAVIEMLERKEGKEKE
ncbi:Related to a retinal short-chain dehydrogenase/reductase [Taphrina deformans PYCC 5710]|uniref:Related to a retinal short-chain dehydrogenase/reductase n=1 Tax=Taphrina deformans (strain PYCC 5710 / ATCC 11124 / CBS 356.35 / IMI 108563 / JCM 9778 / NBRC 8474) TaxID=1097556 RepID=R4XC19_TAPDE|nr:Related to a retinal short-chain dehydrogenase/reductase [Taphrina deformans PYCC 5710]|eukprot:CCG81926.1 Related to a retinal short-chain dehydrogenase/reductase [Taphrina deformans PYCC 5710]